MSRKFILIIFIDLFLLTAVAYCLLMRYTDIVSGLLTALVSITGLYFGGNVGEHFAKK